jgi:hypothetical protein
MSENNKNLAVLVSEMSEIMRIIVDNGGELDGSLEEAFDQANLQIQTKADKYAYFMDRLEAEAEFFKQRAESYLKVAKSCKTLRERLNENIKGAMHMLSVSEIEGGEYRFKLSRSAPKLVIDDKLLPASYLMQVTETVPDKEKIKKAVELGEEISGVKQESVFALRKYLNSKKGG